MYFQRPGKNKYITPQIQNEIISVCSDIILQRVVKESNDCGCFTVLANNWNNLYCQVYDDTSNMQDHIQGVQAHILTKYPISKSLLSYLNLLWKH